MPSALVINPNTSDWMTESIRATADRIFVDPWTSRTAQVEGGPETIDSWIDTSVATIAMLPLIEQNPDVDGVVIACFGDPGIYSFREIANWPVVGIAEAGALTACMVGFRFGILGASSKDVPWMESMLEGYGLAGRCAGVEPINLSVSATGEDAEATLEALADASRRLRVRGAESVILGCGGWGRYREQLEKMTEMPVIDPVAAGCWQLRSLVEMELTSSRVGMYSKPEPKRMVNLERVLASHTALWLSARAKDGFAD